MKFASQYIIWYGAITSILGFNFKAWHIGLFDMLIMPLLLPLLVTYYWWPSIKAYMDKNPQMSLNLASYIASGCSP